MSVAGVGLVAGVIEIGGAAATVLLAIPLAVLALVILRVTRGSGAKPASRPPETPPDSRPNRMLTAVSGEAISRPPADLKPDTGKPMADRIRAAEAAHDDAALSRLYLEQGREEFAAGRAVEAGERLRASIRAAAAAKQVKVQAEARMELAEIAREAGDLTTACEHWQIARALFHGEKEHDGLAETEALMRRHGCPTDWVLNDF